MEKVHVVSMASIAQCAYHPCCAVRSWCEQLVFGGFKFSLVVRGVQVAKFLLNSTPYKSLVALVMVGLRLGFATVGISYRSRTNNQCILRTKRSALKKQRQPFCRKYKRYVHPEIEA